MAPSPAPPAAPRSPPLTPRSIRPEPQAATVKVSMVITVRERAMVILHMSLVELLKLVLPSEVSFPVLSAPARCTCLTLGIPSQPGLSSSRQPQQGYLG